MAKAAKIVQINGHTRDCRMVELFRLDFSAERRLEFLKYFEFEASDFARGRMREAGKFVDCFPSGKTTNPHGVNASPSYQEGAFKSHVVIEMNRHAMRPNGG
jgi:hypothetical protein